MGDLLSVIIPVFNEVNILNHSIQTIVSLLSREAIPYELLIIDDGSIDKTWDVITENMNINNKIKAVRLSRNFGKESAIFAGLDYAKGDCCVVMDCDLQHPPSCLIQMYKLWLYNAFDIIEGKKISRGKESHIHKFTASLFYKLLLSTSGIDLENASDYKLMDRKVVDIIRKMPERQTFFRAMSSWVGFKTTQVFFDVPRRPDEKSKWSFRGLIKLAINAITSYSTLPMQIVTVCGLAFFIFSIILLIQTLYMKLFGHAVAGFTTIIILLLIIGSIIMFSLGLIGIYLAKIYEEVKYRPRYIVRDVIDPQEGCDINGN